MLVVSLPARLAATRSSTSASAGPPVAPPAMRRASISRALLVHGLCVLAHLSRGGQPLRQLGLGEQFQNDNDLKKLTGEDLNSVTFAAVLRFSLDGSSK